MWKNIKQERPTHYGHYYCFGTRWKNTKDEERRVFSAYYQDDENCFTDEDGDDFTNINESVEYWFDFSSVPNPE